MEPDGNAIRGSLGVADQFRCMRFETPVPVADAVHGIRMGVGHHVPSYSDAYEQYRPELGNSVGVRGLARQCRGGLDHCADLVHLSTQDVEADGRQVVGNGGHDVVVASDKRIVRHQIEIRRTVNQYVVVIVSDFPNDPCQKGAVADEGGCRLFDHLHAVVVPGDASDSEVFPNQFHIAWYEI